MPRNSITFDLAPRLICPDLSQEEREAFDIPDNIDTLAKKTITEQLTGYTVTTLNNWIGKLASCTPPFYIETKDGRVTEAGLLEVFKLQIRCCKDIPLRDEQTGKIQKSNGCVILVPNPLVNDSTLFG